jgi:hypothetical protein
VNIAEWLSVAEYGHGGYRVFGAEFEQFETHLVSQSTHSAKL